MTTLENPFGENSCEREKVILGDNYPNYFFDNSTFGKKALDKQTYLIVGRRGVGKSSLIESFSFNSKDAIRSIDVNEPEVYQKVLEKVAKVMSENSEFPSTKIKLIWEYIIWALIFDEYKEESRILEAVDLLDIKESKNLSPSRIIFKIVQALVLKFSGLSAGDLDSVFDQISEKISSEVFRKAQDAVVKKSRRENVVIAIDSIEDYPINNESMMYSVASLVEYASEFNSKFRSKGLHVKVFITAEIYPYLVSTFISNPLKYVTDPLFLEWRPKELLKFICWRWYLFLQEHKQIDLQIKIDWNDYQAVLKSIWEPYFGKEIKNNCGALEPTFPYILRHTQLRPRQLVIICNHAFNLANDKNSSYVLTEDIIAEAISNVELDLANEVINSYKKIYININRILDALNGMPLMFKGNELDKVARRTKSQWAESNYSSFDFRSLVAELGIIGRVRNFDKQTGIISADFEFSHKQRLVLNESDDCVFHPLFIKRFNVMVGKDPMIVYPFPNNKDYEW